VTRALLLVAVLAALTLGARASAQPPPEPTPAPPDTTVAPPDTTAAPAKPKKVKPVITRPREELDRFEIGGGVVRGFFDAVGSFGYRRYLGQSTALESSLMAEVTGTRKDQLTEGALAVYVLLRPVKTYKDSWKLRPLIEIGPAAHVVVQVASLEGIEKTRYKSHVYLKTHPYVGFEMLFTPRFGLVVRGRASIPSHRPLDYAQAAILLR
jgi:hypothetical protein